MRKFDETEILALAAGWRERARIFRAEATESNSYTDRVRLAAMSSTLTWCANNMCDAAGVDPTNAPLPADPEVDRELKATEETLGHEPKEPQP